MVISLLVLLFLMGNLVSHHFHTHAHTDLGDPLLELDDLLYRGVLIGVDELVHVLSPLVGLDDHLAVAEVCWQS